MDTEKLEKAAFEMAIENESDLFASNNKAPLAMSAALVVKHMPSLLATAAKGIAVTALEAAKECDNPEGWQDVLISKLEEDGVLEKMLNALHFTARYTQKLASVAAEQAYGESPESREGNLGAKFGRN